MTLRHESLVAWQRADDLFIKLHRLTLQSFPSHEKFELGSQLRRAAYSVPANIVEGFARRYRRTRLHFSEHLGVVACRSRLLRPCCETAWLHQRQDQRRTGAGHPASLRAADRTRARSAFAPDRAVGARRRCGRRAHDVPDFACDRMMDADREGWLTQASGQKREVAREPPTCSTRPTCPRRAARDHTRPYEMRPYKNIGARFQRGNRHRRDATHSTKGPRNPLRVVSAVPGESARAWPQRRPHVASGTPWLMRLPQIAVWA